jgi:hypothetical protein
VNRPDPDRTLSDDELLLALARVLEEDDPLPSWAVGYATEAFVWRDIDGELAELLHDSVLEEAVVLRDDNAVRLLVFQAGEVTLDIEHLPDLVVGSVSPPRRYRIEIHHGGPDGGPSVDPALFTDDAGMFEVEGEVRGAVRFVVSDPGGQVAILSPWITL